LKMTYFVHPMADVQSENIGQDARIWQFVVVLPGARIGSDVNICSHCFVENDVIIGDRVTIKNGVQLWDGLRIADEVFVGPNVTFTNDRYPRSRNREAKLLSTVVEKGASIGAGAVICPGVTIGAGSMVGAGAVVTRDVSAGTLVVGNPARQRDLQK
jgi:UDP-2-acetamido-3-amino-2,3-dideoxy-glucuronate N-acetyltransferase